MTRGLVLAALVAVGLLSIALQARQAQGVAAKATIATMRPGRNLYLITGGGGNTAALVTDDGVVVVDSKLPGWNQAILDAISLVTENPVTTIINTHAHVDHTGSNNGFAPTVEFVSHANTKTHMEKLEAFKGPGARFLPKRTFTDKTTLKYGPDQVDLYYFGAGHSDGDAIVAFPALGVALAGDLFPGKEVPSIDTANGGSGVALPQTLARAVAELKGIDKVIPGHLHYPTGPEGAVVPRWKDFQEYADFTRDLLTAVRDAHAAGTSVDEAVAGLRMPDRYKDYSMVGLKPTVQAIYDELKR